MDHPELSKPTQSAPRWSKNTKFGFVLALTAIVIFLVIKFEVLLGPILIAFILAYLFHPLANLLYTRLKIPWRLSAGIIYILALGTFISLIAWGGVSLINQVESLVGFIQRALTESLPKIIADWSAQPVVIGPYSIDFANLDVSKIGDEILANLEPIVTNLGGLVTSIASGTATAIGWLFFSFWLSYFLLSETGGVRNKMFSVRIPGYDDEIARMRLALARIWNAFLRGQLIVLGITIVFYAFFLGPVGVKFDLGLALLAGAARFVPYVGPFVAWSTYFLVAFFQGTTLFGLPPLTYAIVVVGVALVADSAMDNLVQPRIMADALRVHPAIIFMAFIIGASLLGLIGVFLAAPVAASAKLFLTYAFAKIFDEDPWKSIPLEHTPLKPIPFAKGLNKIWQRLIAWMGSAWTSVSQFFSRPRA
jgi:predicted PurR-regulated permease PerM